VTWRSRASSIFLDAYTVKPYIAEVKIGRVQHRGLLRFIEDDDARELPPDLVKRLRNILAMLISAEDMAKVSGPPGWRIHQLKGDRAGTWSVSVSGNWRLTFAVEGGEVRNLDLEDYH
jgi:proteic killer suppression protein